MKGVSTLLKRITPGEFENVGAAAGGLTFSRGRRGRLPSANMIIKEVSLDYGFLLAPLADFWLGQQIQ